MVYKKAKLKDGSVVYIRQHIVLFSIVYFSKEGIGYDDLNVGGELISTFLEKIERDSVEPSNEDEWNNSFKLYRVFAEE